MLVSGTDGVGTKLKIAFLMDKHDTVGIDCVAMCVNDVVCCGAKPLFFLDYIACGKNVPEKHRGHRLRRGGGLRAVRLRPRSAARPPKCPASIPEDEYDLAGFCRGRGGSGQDRRQPERCSAGDVLIGLASSGVHSNGFSLVRKVFDIEETAISTALRRSWAARLGETLLTPTRIYVKPVLAAAGAGRRARRISHITGGGFYENIPALPARGPAAQHREGTPATPAHLPA